MSAFCPERGCVTHLVLDENEQQASAGPTVPPVIHLGTKPGSTVLLGRIPPQQAVDVIHHAERVIIIIKKKIARIRN
jgi:hypothetical protein